jgi:hypothetical protein
MKNILVLLILGILNQSSFAEQEGLTKEELFKTSDVVLIGVVDSVKIFKKIDEFSAIYSAEITEVNFKKGLHLENTNKKITVFFRNAVKEGVFEEHSPNLIENQKVKIMGSFKRGVYKKGFVLWISSKERVSVVTE